jgi:cell division septum initiation protein DivIVA
MNPRTVPELLEAFHKLASRVAALERQLAEKPTALAKALLQVSAVPESAAKPASERMREYRARKRQSKDEA